MKILNSYVIDLITKVFEKLVAKYAITKAAFIVCIILELF